MTTATAKHRTLGSPLENGGYLLTVLDTEGCIWDGIFCCWRGGKQNTHPADTHLSQQCYYIIPSPLYLLPRVPRPRWPAASLEAASKVSGKRKYGPFQ